MIGGDNRVNNELPLIGKIDVYEKMEGGEHIKKLIRYLNYEGELTAEKKYIYAINDSKVISIKKGHVAVLPVVSF